MNALLRLREGSPRVLPARSRRGSSKNPCIVSCFVMFPMPSPKLCGSIPAYRSLRRVSFRSIPSAPPPDPFLRANPARAPTPASARLAPARFARLIARARRRTHVSCPFPPGLFSAPAIASLRRKAKRRPRKPPSLYLHSTTLSLQSSPLRAKYENFSTLPEDGRTEKTVTHLSGRLLLRHARPSYRHARTCSGHLPPPLPPDGRMDTRNKSGYDGWGVRV